ncbi:MAG: hypothetical protein NTX79_08030 [Candidatus Micrarchaeota archaeon]|nr:hypothetical protein [Candidatus Micrarchaeota archaeon]
MSEIKETRETIISPKEAKKLLPVFKKLRSGREPLLEAIVVKAFGNYEKPDADKVSEVSELLRGFRGGKLMTENNGYDYVPWCSIDECEWKRASPPLWKIFWNLLSGKKEWSATYRYSRFADEIDYALSRAVCEVEHPIRRQINEERIMRNQRYLSINGHYRFGRLDLIAPDSTSSTGTPPCEAL